MQGSTVSKEDWSLHQQGQEDQKRHNRKIQQAVKDRLPELITEENVIMSDGKKMVKIPVRSLDEYKIRYDHSKKKHIGQGNGDSGEGDVIARSRDGGGRQAGSEPGEDYVEAEVSIEEIETALFSQLDLPDFKQKEEVEASKEGIQFTDIRTKGLTGNIDKKKTMMTAFKRNAMNGEAGFHPILPEDIRYKTWTESKEKESKAAVIAMMDTSGSMGMFEKYIARSFFFWLVKFLNLHYAHVEIRFISHHTEAKEVEEETFFTKGESGGTICSSAYRKALDIVGSDYPQERYNVYAFHISDGDNLTSDNEKCLPLIQKLAEHCNMVGYGEVSQYHRQSSLMSVFAKAEEEEIRTFIMRRKTEVLDALKYFLSKKSHV
ncbi:sporulation protein YhbH [Jeotgalibacillus alimentarius]|uniref:Sporulation protein YhbH n=1 Tax=Jeotgalibacillus alimentarius TaxID=135826 RepID=A0A0C2S7V5_9BACL|nr:sporulation protein YhbH [Jeotgalibacillus alimentarius]KIL50074.1 sporulation protein YhbH [Jeotgalibacillus alimentarius]